MPTKPRYFDSNLYYHIYNCGTEKRDIFVTDRDYHRFLDTIKFYLHDQRISFAQFQDLNVVAKQLYSRLNPTGLENLRIKLISYCLMPNHFHFLLKQAKENGITRFLSDISNSHARYFNIKNERIGKLFQGAFKSKEIPTDEALLQVSRYIHLNPVISKKTNPRRNLKPEDYSFSSYKYMISTTFPDPTGLEIDFEEITNLLNLVGGAKNYQEFVEAKIDTDPRVGVGNLAID